MGKLTDGSSILNKNIAKKTIITPEYGSVRALSKKLLATGKKGGKTAFKFDQEFPSHVSAIIKTRLNMAGNLSGTKAIFDTLSGVVVGDRITADNIPNNTIVTVTALDPDGDNANECNLSSSIDLTDDDSVSFYRPQKYYINIYPKEGTTLGANIPVQNPRYTINQYDSPLLLLKVTTTDVQINANSINYNYTGRANAFPSQVRNVPSMFSVSWDLTRSGGTFSALKTDGIPAFSSTTKGLSDWSNSVYATNGGMHVEIFNEKVTGIGTSTCTITADVVIKKWGTENVTMILDLDNILT